MPINIPVIMTCKVISHNTSQHKRSHAHVIMKDATYQGLTCQFTLGSLNVSSYYKADLLQ